MTPLTYKKAGVDIDKADAFVKRIKPLLDKTVRPEVLGKIGGFSGLFMPRLKAIKNPVLVSATDGVGTKLLLAEMLERYDTVGIDLVAMCVDDVVVTGAEPLFFLDYIACGKLNDKKLYALIKGITKGCQEAGCALIGGETAELPEMYEKNRFDLAGFCVGVVDREKMIDGRLCCKGDKIIGLASSGLHSNGYSLVRKVFSPKELNGRLGQELLRPTRIYTGMVLKILRKIRIKAMAHITGGGFIENIPRVLPSKLGAEIKKDSWPVPSIFLKIQERSRMNEKEMFRTFNMGVGMALILGPQNARRALQLFAKMGQNAWMIGEVIEGTHEVLLQDKEY